MDLSERIRGRAYEIWIASGYRDGEADHHWLAAEQEILSGPRSAAVAKAPAKRIRGRATVKRSGGAGLSCSLIHSMWADRRLLDHERIRHCAVASM